MTKPLVLVVDDEVEYANKIATAVKSNDKYEAVIAYSAREALGELKKRRSLFGLRPNRVRCILLDLKMPEMDGLQFLKKVRREYGNGISVILVTAFEDTEKWEAALDGFIAGYLKKPFERQELLDQLDELFSGKVNAQSKMISDTLIKGVERLEELKRPDRPGT